MEGICFALFDSSSCGDKVEGERSIVSLSALFHLTVVLQVSLAASNSFPRRCRRDISPSRGSFQSLARLRSSHGCYSLRPLTTAWLAVCSGLLHRVLPQTPSRPATALSITPTRANMRPRCLSDKSILSRGFPL